MVKPLMRKYPPMMITAWIFLIGIVLVLPFGLGETTAVPWMELNLWQWFSVLYVIVFVTFLTYLLNMIGIHKGSPTLASSYIYFQPLLAGIFAWMFTFFLDRNFTGDITWAKVGCTVMIFTGVYLVSRSEGRAERK
jgi:drug/metabolite transporter (DMT)-like permease